MNDQSSAEQLRSRIQAALSSRAGFVRVTIRSSKPIIIAVEFNDPIAAELFAAEQQLANAAASIDVGNSTTVLLPR